MPRTILPGLFDPASRTFDVEALRAELSARALTTQDIADRAGLSTSSVNAARRGIRIREATAAKIRQLLYKTPRIDAPPSQLAV